MPLDVKPEHLEMVQAILRTHLPEREVWAFGSRVNGKAKPASDLDLCVMGPPLAYETTANLKQDFSDSDIPYAVDIVEWTSCSEQFRELIAQNKFQLTL